MDTPDPTVAATNPNQGEEVSDWVTAPADSHVAAFRLVDRSKSEFGASSEIWVKFKKGQLTYRYKLSSHDGAKQIFADLKGSGHPGEVIDAELKKPRVPFEKGVYD